MPNRRRVKVPLYLSDTIVPISETEKQMDSVLTYPANGDVDVSIKCIPRVIFKGGVMDKSTMTHINVYLIDEAGKKVPCAVDALADNTALIYPYKELTPQTKYFYRLRDQLKNIFGDKIKAPDKQIYFITGD